MSGRPISLTTLFSIFAILIAMPVFGQRQGEVIEVGSENRDKAAIRGLLNYYEQAFNERDIEWRMALCLDTYQEYGFENGVFQHVWNYDEVKREIGGYWASIDELEYSIGDIEVQLDGPMATVRAYTTHLADNDSHASVVHFSLVKIDGAWRIAGDMYNIVRRYDN